MGLGQKDSHSGNDTRTAQQGVFQDSVGSECVTGPQPFPFSSILHVDFGTRPPEETMLLSITKQLQLFIFFYI